MTRVLALDIAARNTGAAFDGAEGRPAFATLRQTITPNVYGPLGTKFRLWLLDLITLSPPDHIAFEAPWVASGSKGSSRPTDNTVPRMLLGLAFLAEQIAHELGIPSSELAVSTARKYFVGEGYPKEPKEAVQARCRMFRWNYGNEHEADAAAVWAYTKSMLDPKWAPTATPLFARAEELGRGECQRT